MDLAIFNETNHLVVARQVSKKPMSNTIFEFTFKQKVCLCLIMIPLGSLNNPSKTMKATFLIDLTKGTENIFGTVR